MTMIAAVKFGGEVQKQIMMYQLIPHLALIIHSFIAEVENWGVFPYLSYMCVIYTTYDCFSGFIFETLAGSVDHMNRMRKATMDGSARAKMTARARGRSKTPSMGKKKLK